MPIATSNFLVPNGTFIVVLIAFIIVLGVITKYVLPVLNAALSERQEQIRGELEAADKAKADAEEADVERRAVAGAGPRPRPARSSVPGRRPRPTRSSPVPPPRARPSTTGSWPRPRPRSSWPGRPPSKR